MKIKHLLLSTLAVLAMAGCGEVSSSDIDLGGITPAAPVVPVTEQVCTETFPTIGYTENSDLLKGIIAADLSPSINPTSIQMNHYISQTMTGEAFTPIVDYYLGDSTAPAKLQLAADASVANPVEHIIVIRFMQDSPAAN